MLFRGLHEDFGGSSSWSILNQLSCIFNVATEFSSLCFAQFALRLLARLFTSLMVHPSTLFAEFTRRWSCAITIQASTAVEIVFKWTARTVLPLQPFLQSFPFSVSLKPETSWLFYSLNTLLLEERQNSSRWSHQAVWDFSHFGSRLVVVSITTFCYGFTRTCLHRNFSRNREIPWVEHSWTSCRRRRLWICKNVSRYTMRTQNFGCKF